MPFALRIHLAVSLVALLSLGYYLSPTMDLHFNVLGVVLGAVMVVVAIGMVTGWNTREAAIPLIAAGPLGMIEFGFWEVIKRVDMLGPALRADHRAGPLVGGLGARPRPRGHRDQMRIAVWALKVAVGLALIVVASPRSWSTCSAPSRSCTTAPSSTSCEDRPADRRLEFVRIAGCLEVLFGLLMISGACPRSAS